MALGFSIVNIIGLVETAINTITTVERLIRGRGRGAEKKEIVLEELKDTIATSVKKGEEEIDEFGEAYSFIAGFRARNVDWGCLVGKLPVLYGQVSELIDVLVGIMNTINACTKDDE